jgi:type IV secretory pathway TraG/TraD family ATPase VirD4
MNPDEVLRLENRKCLALFKGHKPALLYKMTPEELPDYAGLTTCRVIDYIPEWRRNEAETAPQKQAPVQKEASNSPKPPDKEKQPDCSGQPPTYDLAEDDEIGMVECTVDSILNQ